MLLTELLGGLSYTCAVPLDGVEISDIVYDSRKAEPGCVFFCLRGADTDGHRYAGSAVQKGAAAIVAEDPVSYTHLRASTGRRASLSSSPRACPMKR